VGVHDLKIALIPLVPGLSKLIMRYEPGTGRHKFTLTVSGNEILVMVDPTHKQHEIIASILDGVKQAGPPLNDVSSPQIDS
jgi:hypothetical protein